MNWAKALCMRAIGPDIITKRLPDILLAVSKSRPFSVAASSKCSFGLKSNVFGIPQRLISTLAASSRPSGVSSNGIFGMLRSMFVRAAFLILASSFKLVTSAFFSETMWRRRSNSPSSLLALAAPTSLLALFCSACATSVAWMQLRRAASSSSIFVEIAGSPRRAKAASNAVGLSRIARISCMICFLRKNHWGNYAQC